MKKLRPSIASLTAAALLAGCADAGNGPRFSELFDQSASAEGTGIQFTGVVRAVVILATHEASSRQRQVAEQNGRRALAKLKARQASSEEAPAVHTTPRQKTANATTPVPKPGPKHKPGLEAAPKPAPEPAPAPEPTPAVARHKAHRELPRIIAVATEKDEHTDKNAAKAIMLFDTHAEEIISNKVYDIKTEPRPGDDVRFETHSASYIGASL